MKKKTDWSLNFVMCVFVILACVGIFSIAGWLIDISTFVYQGKEKIRELSEELYQCENRIDASKFIIMSKPTI